MPERKDSWLKCKLGDFLSVKNGYAFKSEDFQSDGIPVIRIMDIKDGIATTDRAVRIPPEKAKDAFYLSNGDVLIAMSGSVGKIGRFRSNERALQNQRVGSLIPKDPKMTRDFLYYLALFHQQDIIRKGYGGSQPNISSKQIESLETFLPPLPDQKRIVAKLDTLFSHLDQLRSRLDKIPVLLKQFRQAVLTQAVTGKLRGTVYRLEPLGNLGIEIQTGPFGSALHKEDYVVGGIPIINPSHIRDGKIIPDVSVSVKASKANELRTWQLKNNDVILGRRGEMGRAAKYDEQDGEMLCGTGSIILRAGALTAPQFLCYYLRSPYAVNYLQEHAVGSTMTNLNQNVILSLPFPVVSVAEQANLVAAIDNLLSLADSIEKSYLSVISSIVQLPTQLLAKAFSGE